MNDFYTKQELRQIGITRPSKQLMENYRRAAEEAVRQGLDDAPEPVTVAVRGATELTVTPQARVAPPAPPVLRPVVPPKPRSDGKPLGSSKSCLLPVLRGEGVLEKRVRVGKPGRPRIIATWMPDVAATTADGTTLPEALRIHGVELTATQLRALYRNKAFKEMRLEASEKYLMGECRSGEKTQSTETPLRGIPPESDR